MTKPKHKCKRGLYIEPPPREDGDEPLFRVVYIIDVNSADAREAAEYTHRIMTDPESLAPVLNVLDCNGNETVLDLSAEPTDEKAVHQTSDSDEQARSFVKAAVTKCPKCGSEDLSFQSVDIDGQSAYQKASCGECEARFYSIYRLVGFGLHGDEMTEIHTVAEDFGEINE